MESVRVITADTVDLRVSSSVAQDALPRRFSKHLTIPALKDKLELISGGCAASMQLSLYDCSDKFVCSVDSATLMLGAFPVQDGMRLHVHDKTIQNVSLDGSNVPQKFELTDDEYKSRKGTLRSFLEQTKQGKYDPEEAERMASAREQKELQEKQQLASISLESRCEVRRSGQPTVRGAVRFVGATKFRPGVWVGVQLDEPLGKNDGSVDSHSYFSCPAKYGIFVRPASVFCGDFPELSLMDEDEDEM